MSAKHTPGPWKRERRVKGRLMDVTTDRPLSGAETPVCIARDIELANADLIAAAPDLLEALEGVLTYAESRIEDMYDEVDQLGPDADRPQEDLPSARNLADRAMTKLTLARAAIAKARKGGAP